MVKKTQEVAATATYRVNDPIRLNKKRYAVGEMIELTADEARQLIKRGIVSAPDGSATVLASDDAPTAAQIAEAEARVKADLVECQRLREEAAADRAEAQKLRDAAADDAFKAATDRDVAQKLRDEATADRKAAEAAEAAQAKPAKK